MIKYSIKEKQIKSFSSAIEEFVQAIQEKEPNIIEYNVFQGSNGLSFVHYISFLDEESQMKHVRASHTKRFNKILKKSVVANPVYIPLTDTGQAATFVPNAKEEEAKIASDSSLYRSEGELQQMR